MCVYDLTFGIGAYAAPVPFLHPDSGKRIEDSKGVGCGVGYEVRWEEQFFQTIGILFRDTPTSHLYEALFSFAHFPHVRSPIGSLHVGLTKSRGYAAMSSREFVDQKGLAGSFM